MKHELEKQKMRQEYILYFNLKIDSLVEEVKEAEKKFINYANIFGYMIKQDICIYIYICETCNLYKNGYLYKRILIIAIRYMTT